MTTEQIDFIGSARIGDTGNLSEFCQRLFASFSRADQRRWGEVYVRGLVSLPGRKTIRRICDHVVGWRADQSLQQFVNQSPWQWTPVRNRLARELVATGRPRAIVLQDAVFPKNGCNSVGVARQFAPAAGRLLNCQLGLAAFLAWDDRSVPVNWRLLLPRAWHDDAERRSRTRVPAGERHRPAWACGLDMLDELLIDWDLPTVPLLADARFDRQAELLLRGLDERNVPYLVQVVENMPVAPPPRLTVAGSTTDRPTTAGEVAIRARRLGHGVVTSRETADGRMSTVRFVLAPMQGALSRVRPYRANRAVLAEWTSGQGQPSAVYVTNLGQMRLPELIHLARTRRQVAEDMTRLHDETGLGHFEGRSYPGWHHHVTLVSMAHAYRSAGPQCLTEDAWAARPSV
ncbi:IS701 family transposase [Actinophytocola sp.]|uniref:IS701 family transposase n=1 Tax=Actinophytocola sp. TaxID=1872138 RepID=UPI00389A2490